MFKPTRSSLALLAAAAVAGPTLVLAAAPAQAVPSVERYGSCGAGHYEFSVEHDDGGFEVESQLEHLPRGQKWRITLKHDGKTYYNAVRRADHEGDIDVDRFRANSAGTDVFTYRAKRVGAKGACSAKITLS